MTPGNFTAVETNNNEFKVLEKDKNPRGLGSCVDIEEGVVFVRGFFVKVSADNIILEKYSTKPTYKVGLSITEKLISNAEDSSLQDNAGGTSNQNAVGVDRLQIELKLAKFPVDSDTDTNFIELVRVEAGNIAASNHRPTIQRLRRINGKKNQRCKW